MPLSTRRRPAAALAATLATGLLLGLLSALTAAPAAAATLSIWGPGAAPASAPDADTSAVELGVKFRSDVPGRVTGVRFYKGAGNSGTHTGSLWNSAGTRLATVTFTGETATGWQQATFATPVTIAANTTYVVSYYAPNGRYHGDNNAFATAGVDNGVLHALRNGVDGGNGVYRYGTGGGFPNASFQASNYWVDVVLDTDTADTTPPAVTGRAPAAGATGVAVSSTVTATFSEALQAGTAALALSGPGGAVGGSTAYDAGSRTATFTPAAALAPSTTYSATVSGARDSAGNLMTPVTWTFTTGTVSPSGCPCSIWAPTAAPAVADAGDASAVELGVKFRSSQAGYVTGVRFWKATANTGTHTGSVWNATGTRLATGTFTGETASGWQQLTLPAPVPVSANTTYVASYHTGAGHYSSTAGGLSAAVSRGPLTALASAANGGNGVYAYGAGGFPTNTFQGSNYWVDVVFDTTATDTTPPTVTTRSPAPGATGVPVTTRVTASFGETVTASSVVMNLSGPGGAVAGTTAYDTGTATASFTPAAALTPSSAYTATVSGARDAAGNQMAPMTWTFSTAAPAPPPPDQGPGGPVLVVRSSAAGASTFTSYTAEILRGEGLNAFAVADLASVTAATLGRYSTVILGQTPLTAAQASMFSTWVTGGGNLVAFRPDAQLASLLGLTGGSATLAEGYLGVDTASAPGAGITNQTMQYHGTASRWTLSGARAVATLYSNATTATTSPAVSLRDVGTAGGQAAAFLYDLPQSIVLQRQGNPAWAGQERDGQAPIRSDDLFFGGSATDWVNLSKVAIPQADEQQRLLANLLTTVNLDRAPLPRFWYFPRGAKAVVVATGDDHAGGGSAGRFDTYAANSQPGCVVDLWQCLRFSSYVFPNSPLTGAQAANYDAAGFEVGLHPQSNCGNFTPASLDGNYSTQLATWRQRYAGVPSPVTSRFHCIVWSDWLSQATTSLRYGIRLDTNYYYWPGSWVQNRPGFMTGSGMPQRFATTTGSMVDVYQAATQLTDESDQAYPFTPNTLLDNALGPLGYHGAFVANMHTDSARISQDDGLVASARARNVPMITGRQLLTWTDGRNRSTFSDIAWSANRLTFSLGIGAGANGLTAMLPSVAAGGATLQSLSVGGTAVPFSRTTVKGVEYATFQAAPGAYTATYGAGAARAAVAAPSAGAVASDDSVTIRVTGASGSTAQVRWGTSAGALTRTAVDAAQGSAHRVTLGGLTPRTAYWYRVRVTAPDGSVRETPVRRVDTRAPDGTAPGVSGRQVDALPDGTVIARWSTDEAAEGTLLLGRDAGSLRAYREGTSATSHAVAATGLEPRTRYAYRLRSTDAAGNVRLWPAAGRPPAVLVTPAAGVADAGAVRFRTGDLSGGAVITDDGAGSPLGGVTLAAGTAAGSFTSRVLDAEQMAAWRTLTHRADVPAGAGVRVLVRTGSSPVPDASWTGWRPATGAIGGASRYVQYRADLTAAGAAPVLRSVGVVHGGTLPAEHGEG